MMGFFYAPLPYPTNFPSLTSPPIPANSPPLAKAAMPVLQRFKKVYGM